MKLRRILCSKATILLLVITALFYIAFLCIDICSKSVAASSALKYCCTALCLTVAVLSYRDPYSKQDCGLLITALLFTALADYLLLFTSKITIGVMVFCLAHLAHIARLNKSAAKICAVMYLIASILLFVFAVLGLKMPYAYLASFVYAVLILTSTISAFSADMPKQNLILLRMGMVLFVLCDICVTLFNVMPASSIIHKAALQLMWFFYVPSQVLLALSTRRL